MKWNTSGPELSLESCTGSLPFFTFLWMEVALTRSGTRDYDKFVQLREFGESDFGPLSEQTSQKKGLGKECKNVFLSCLLLLFSYWFILTQWVCLSSHSVVQCQLFQLLPATCPFFIIKSCPYFLGDILCKFIYEYVATCRKTRVESRNGILNCHFWFLGHLWTLRPIFWPPRFLILHRSFLVLAMYKNHILSNKMRVK